ncbi:MAG: hypothetical protein E6176_04915 [Clostridium celatum]|nr:hypothetical protein [Clostridium celatum]
MSERGLPVGVCGPVDFSGAISDKPLVFYVFEVLYWMRTGL